jgi:hypothetical protein
LKTTSLLDFWLPDTSVKFPLSGCPACPGQLDFWIGKVTVKWLACGKLEILQLLSKVYYRATHNNRYWEHLPCNSVGNVELTTGYTNADLHWQKENSHGFCS